jgi:hypothetical protein
MKSFSLLTTIILLCSCGKFEGEIYTDSLSKCRRDSRWKPLDTEAKSYFIRNTSRTKAYTFTIKVTVTADGIDDEDSPYTRSIKLLPGEEKYLGCSPIHGTKRTDFGDTLTELVEIRNLSSEYEIVGQLEKKP